MTLAPSPSFPHEVILNILLCLDQESLVKSQLVCKHWYGYAQVARREAFLRRWGFKDIIAEPLPRCLLETIPTTSIVRKHCVQPGESVPQLALRCGCGPTDILRLNNLMNPLLLQHRHFVYLPVTRLESLRGASASFEYSPLLCRHLLVAVPPPPPPPAEQAKEGGEGEGKERGAGPEAEQPTPPVKFNRMLLREMQAHVRRMAAARAAARAVQGPPMHAGAGMGAGMGMVALSGGGGAAAAAAVDVPSARFYLEEAGGSPEVAARMYVEDSCWEEGAPMLPPSRGARRRPEAGPVGSIFGRGRQGQEREEEEEEQQLAEDGPAPSLAARQRAAVWGGGSGGGGAGPQPLLARALGRVFVGCCGRRRHGRG